MLPNKKRSASSGFAIFAVIVLLAATALSAPDVPSIDQVYQAARSGHLAQAEAMTQDVLRAYPNSARAHYVMAQILAAEGRTSEARGYLEKAERLKPGLPFANPDSVAKLERRINRGAQAPQAEHPVVNQFHWGWLLAGAVVLFILWRSLRRPRVAPTNYRDGGISAGGVSPGPVAPSAGYGGGYGGGGYGGGGLLSSVLAGLGFGAAAAAGQRVMDRLFGGEQREEPMDPGIQQMPSDSGDLGGDAFGVQPGQSSSGGWDDQGDQTGASANPDDNLGAGDSNGGWDDSSGGGGGDTDV
jgi:hypothetical protein